MLIHYVIAQVVSDTQGCSLLRNQHDDLHYSMFPSQLPLNRTLGFQDFFNIRVNLGNMLSGTASKCQSN